MIRPPFVASLFVLAGAVWPGDVDARVRSLQEIRQDGVVMQQWDNSCGAAALATVLTYGFGHPVSEQEAAKGMLRTTEPLKVRYRGGFSLLDMKRFVESQGFDGTGYRQLTIETLRALESPIVSVTLHGYAHFVVVRRVSDDEVWFADPAYGNRTLSVERFAQAWTNGIAFVVARRNP